MVETASTWKVIFLVLEFFFFGASLFAENHKTEIILRMLTTISMIIVFSI